MKSLGANESVAVPTVADRHRGLEHGQLKATVGSLYDREAREDFQDAFHARDQRLAKQHQRIVVIGFDWSWVKVWWQSLRNKIRNHHDRQ